MSRLFYFEYYYFDKFEELNFILPSIASLEKYEQVKHDFSRTYPSRIRPIAVK